MNSLDRELFDICAKALQKAREAAILADNSVAQKRANIQTTADLVAEKEIIDHLRENKVSCTIYSEEQKEPLKLYGGRYEIVVDPIDGSFMFLHGIKTFTSSAMIVLEDRKVKYAFVQSIVDTDLYYCDEEAAYLNGKRLVCDTKNIQEPYFITGYAGSKERASYVPKLASIPSSYYFLNDGGPKYSALVAANMIDAAVEFKPTKFQEFAGAFIAQKAGAYIATIDGAPIQMDPLSLQTMITSRSEKLLRELQKALA